MYPGARSERKKKLRCHSRRLRIWMSLYSGEYRVAAVVLARLEMQLRQGHTRPALHTARPPSHHLLLLFSSTIVLSTTFSSVQFWRGIVTLQARSLTAAALPVLDTSAGLGLYRYDASWMGRYLRVASPANAIDGWGQAAKAQKIAGNGWLRFVRGPWLFVRWSPRRALFGLSNWQGGSQAVLICLALSKGGENGMMPAGRDDDDGDGG